MNVTLTPLLASRLEKAAVDNGFDRELPSPSSAVVCWLAFASTQCPLRVWLGVRADGSFVVALSQDHVAHGLEELGTPSPQARPEGATAALIVVDIVALHRLLRRAFQLSKTLPDELLRAFERQTASLPRSTDGERVVIHRIGQDIFRRGQLDYWEERCAVTGLAVPSLLRASHIKPWADCATDAERLDVWNGLLLAPHLDAAFDRGLITFGDDGTIMFADALDARARQILGFDSNLRASGLGEGHRAYLTWHRQRVFGG